MPAHENATSATATNDGRDSDEIGDTAEHGAEHRAEDRGAERRPDDLAAPFLRRGDRRSTPERRPR